MHITHSVVILIVLVCLPHSHHYKDPNADEINQLQDIISAVIPLMVFSRYKITPGIHSLRPKVTNLSRSSCLSVPTYSLPIYRDSYLPSVGYMHFSRQLR